MNKTYKLVVSGEVQKALYDLRQRTEDKDLGEILRRALATYDCLTTEIQAGGQVFVRRKNGTEEELKLF